MPHKPIPSLPHPLLIGLMGCGKSSIGRRLAKRLAMPLIDLDELIVERAGSSIPDIFAQFGEDYFRDLESKMLHEVIGKQAIIATGGGVVLREANRNLLKAHWPVIWLKAPPEFLAERITGDTNRPLIANQDALQKLTTLAAERYPLYAACADLLIARDDMNKDDITTLIIDFMEKMP
ncbi:MAG: shikimate kinase [Mariprofundaceae bacterium]|nr:shikimate kinase [Mariprofundaceae bacterium]